MIVFVKAEYWNSMLPGQWAMAPDAVFDPNQGLLRREMIRCPKCGGRSHLSYQHTIYSDGHVMASVVCPRTKCGDGKSRCDFHDFITLGGWTPEPRTRGQGASAPRTQPEP